MITYQEYMANSSELHHAYYLQFVTQQTKEFVLRSLKVDDIKKALENGDMHLNEIKIPYNNMGRGGNWWWDEAPFNLALMKACGATNINSPSTHTCVGKAAAKALANLHEVKNAA
jgi:hypothetical protein